MKTGFKAVKEDKTLAGFLDILCHSFMVCLRFKKYKSYKNLPFCYNSERS